MAENIKHDQDQIVFGRNPVLEVIENSSVQVNKIWIAENFNDNHLKKTIISFAKEKKIPFMFVPDNKLKNLTSNQKHQGIVLSISPVEYKSVGEIIENTLQKYDLKIVLIANEIEDNHNLGAIIRTFAGAGGKGIILTGKSNVGINATTIKTSAGALFRTEFARVTNCVNVLNQLKESGFWIVGTDIGTESKSIYETDLPDMLAIVVGNEHEGLGKHVKNNCDFLVKIPINEMVESLNVSVAFGIILFEALRQNKYFKAIS